MENDVSGGGLQPVRDAPGAVAPFLPVTRRDRLFCVLLVSVILVCGYHAARDLSALASTAEPVQAVAGAESVTMNSEEVPFVDDDVVVRYDEQEGVEIVELPDNVRGLYGLDESAGAASRHVGDGRLVARLARADGRFVYEGADHREQQGEFLECGATGEFRYHDGFSERPGGAQDALCAGALRENCEIAQEQGRYGAVLGGDTRSAVLGLSGGAVSPLMHQAAWYGGIGVRTFAWLQTKAATSTVGQKLAKAGITPLLAMSLGIGGFDVAVTAEEMMAREEVVMVEAMETQLANRAIMADAGEEIYVLGQRILYNAENGISMSASETIAAACSDFEAACTTGVLPTATHATLESAILDAFTRGCMSVEALQPLAAIGEQLMEFCDLEPVPFSDAEGFLTTDGGNFGNGDISFDEAMDGGSIVSSWKTTNGEYLLKESGIAKLVYTEPFLSGNYYYVKVGAYNFDGVSKVNTMLPVGNKSNDVPSDFINYINASSDVVVEKHSYPYNSNTSVPIAVYSFDDVTDGYNDFFESGGQIVGNDAQFGDGGELVDSGTVNVTPALYGDTNPSTWADALVAGEVNAVKPEAEMPSSGDEVVEGSGKGSTVGESTGKTNPPTAPQLMYSIDTSMGDLQDAVSDKFPFSIPFNVSRTVDMLVAAPEAPHFTWVFALPTGNVEYEVDLSPFSPVAHVLRVMLDVLMVFVVISLLGKIAQVWGFFDKAAD